MIARLSTVVLASMTLVFFASSILGEMGRITRHHAFLTESASLALAGAALFVLSHDVEGGRGILCRLVGVVVTLFGMTMTFAILYGARP